MKKLLALLLYTQLSSAEVDLHGLVSQSFVFSDNNHYLFEGSRGGSLEFSEFFLNFSRQFNDNLRIGMQFSARQFGDVENLEPSLDWGYGDYRFNSYLGLRVGKVKQPMGIFNENRDIDFSKHSIILDQGIYPESFRMIVQSYSGAGLYGSLNLEQSSLGFVDYQIYGGTTHIPGSYSTIQAAAKVYNSAAEPLNNVKIAGSFVDWNIIHNLRFAHSYMYFSGNMTIDSENVGANLAAHLPGGDPIASLLGSILNGAIPENKEAIRSWLHLNIYSMEYQFGDFMFTTEFMHWILSSRNEDDFVEDIQQIATDNINAGVVPQGVIQAEQVAALFAGGNEYDKKAFAVNLLYQVTHNIGVYGGFGYADQKTASDDGLRTKDPNTRGAFQYDYSVGLNSFLTDHFLLKVEYHYVVGDLMTYNPIEEIPYNDGHLFLTRISFSF